MPAKASRFVGTPREQRSTAKQASRVDRVAATVLAGDHEHDVLANFAQPLGHLHEDVETAERLQAARHVGDDLHPRRDGPLAYPSRECGPRAP